MGSPSSDSSRNHREGRHKTKRKKGDRKRSSSKKKRSRKKDRKKSEKSTVRSSSDSSSDDENVPRSSITGKKIKMYIKKTKDDLIREKARKDLLKFMNSSC